MSPAIPVPKISLLALFGIVLFSIFLRFYNLPSHFHFAGDQGRDALVMLEMIRGERLQLLGPSSSIGQFYLGPLFYYVTAPSLWLANFDPVGPAFLHAALGVFTSLCLYFFLHKRSGEISALIASGLYSVLPTFILYNRFAWNPNTIPFFLVIFFWSATLYLEKRSTTFLILMLFFLSALLQLHLVAMTLILPVGFALFGAYQKHKSLKQLVLSLIASLVAVLLSLAPFLLALLRSSSGTTLVISLNIQDILINGALLTATLLQTIGGKLLLPLIVGLTIFSCGSMICYLRKKIFRSPWMVITVSTLVSSVLALSFLQAEIELHYVLVPLLSLLIILSYGIGEIMRLINNKWINFSLMIAFILLLFFSYFSKWQSLLFDSQISASEIKVVVQTILQKAEGRPFQLAVLSESNNNDPYRYFLKLVNAPLQEGTDVAPELFILCEDANNCQPQGNPHWEIAKFEVGHKSRVVRSVETIGRNMELHTFKARE